MSPHALSRWAPKRCSGTTIRLLTTGVYGATGCGRSGASREHSRSRDRVAISPCSVPGIRDVPVGDAYADLLMGMGWVVRSHDTRLMGTATCCWPRHDLIGETVLGFSACA